MTDEEAERRAVSSVWDDVEPWRGKCLAEHADGLVSVLRFADASIAGSPRGAALRAWRDRRDDQAEALWLRLVREARR